MALFYAVAANVAAETDWLQKHWRLKHVKNCSASCKGQKEIHMGCIIGMHI